MNYVEHGEIIGIGCIVTHDILDNSITVSVLSRVTKTIDKYYIKYENNINLTNNLDRHQKNQMIE